MELKYCECCGGLLLRPAGTGGVYCNVCGPRMRALPQAELKTQKRRGRPPKAAATASMVDSGAMREAAGREPLFDIDAVSADAITPILPREGIDAAAWERGRRA